MNLVTSVEALLKRKLTPEEVANMAELQTFYKIYDDDPLLIVVAMMARTQIIAETLPNLLQQKVNETIELHRTLMREQSILMSKELIATIAEQIKVANMGLHSTKIGWRSGWIRYAGCVVGGGLLFAVAFRVGRLFNII